MAFSTGNRVRHKKSITHGSNKWNMIKMFGCTVCSKHTYNNKLI